MSETRRIRHELRASFTQHLYHYYEELRRTNTDSEAKSFVLEAGLDVLKPFREGDELSLSLSLQKLEKKWLEKEKEAIKQKDYDTQYQASDILQAIKTLKMLPTEGDTKWY